MNINANLVATSTIKGNQMELLALTMIAIFVKMVVIVLDEFA